MAKIIECVPNISEGRNNIIIEQIVDTIRDSAGVKLADNSSDVNHNRTVITFFGDPESVENAVVKLVAKSVELIDLTKHKGEHPRMGAVDVIPFIPIKNISMEEAVELSKRVAERIWLDFGLPVFMYENSATAPHRVNLAAIRKGQFEGMAEKVLLDEWKPDYGDLNIHPTAGVVAVGARKLLVAFNINLSTSDVSIAGEIAKIIRESNGGFDGVKSIGIKLESNNTAQVSINLTDITKTPLYRIVETVRFEASRFGVSITGTEIIGLSPASVLIESAMYYLQLTDFRGVKQTIEYYL